MPIPSIDSSEDPELETLLLALQRARRTASLSSEDAIRFIEGSDDPAFEPIRRELEKARAQSVSPDGALSPNDAIRFFEGSDDPVIVRFRRELFGEDQDALPEDSGNAVAAGLAD